MSRKPKADLTCHDHDCVRRDECGHFMRDLEGDRHIATGRSGGACDLEDFSDTLLAEIE